jgi:hypothetical protein
MVDIHDSCDTAAIVTRIVSPVLLTPMWGDVGLDLGSGNGVTMPPRFAVSILPLDCAELLSL